MVPENDGRYFNYRQHNVYLGVTALSFDILTARASGQHRNKEARWGREMGLLCLCRWEAINAIDSR